EPLWLEHLADPRRLRHGWRRRCGRSGRTLHRRGRRARLRDLARGGLDLALVDPRLHSDRAVRRLRGRTPELDVAAKRVQRNAPLALPLAPAHLGATDGSGDSDAYGFRARLTRSVRRLRPTRTAGHAPPAQLRAVP